MPIISGDPVGTALQVVDQIPIVGDVAANIWTTPALEFIKLPIPGIPQPIPGTSIVSYNRATEWQKYKVVGNKGAVQRAPYIDLWSVSVNTRIENATQGAAMALALSQLGTVGDDLNPDGPRAFFHPIAAMLGISSVVIYNLNVSHFTPVDGGYVSFQLVQWLDPSKATIETEGVIATPGF